jgi:hypothetical protein
MFNEILPRSPHWLYGESMVADFQQEPTPPEQYERRMFPIPILRSAYNIIYRLRKTFGVC